MNLYRYILLNNFTRKLDFNVSLINNGFSFLIKNILIYKLIFHLIRECTENTFNGQKCIDYSNYIVLRNIKCINNCYTKFKTLHYDKVR